jgi:hypothetical protein
MQPDRVSKRAKLGSRRQWDVLSRKDGGLQVVEGRRRSAHMRVSSEEPVLFSQFT